MASLVDNRKLAALLVAIGILGMCYFISLDVFHDPRMADGELGWEELSWWEKGLGLAMAASITAVWLAAVHHAWKRAKKALAVLLLCIWPAALLYAVLPHEEA